MERYLITGASRGIGRAVATRLGAPRRVLLLNGRDREALQQTARLVRNLGAEAVPMPADLSSKTGIESLLASVGSDPIHVLVNNAGVNYVAPVDDITWEQWQRILAVNVTAPFLLTQKLVPLMSAGSAVVNVMSIAARTGFPRWSSYCMSKFALEGFSQSLREELRPRGIRVINVYPSATDTAIWSNVPGEWPREKMLEPGEVAEAVAYALSRPPSVQVDTINVGNIAGTL